jgi:hypothetical protein
LKQRARPTLRDRFRAVLRRAAGARLLAALLLVVAFSAGACQGEAIPYEYAAWNYSDQTYVVLIYNSAGYDGNLVVPAHTAVYSSSGTMPRKAALYDATCSRRLQTVEFHAGAADVVISAQGTTSVPASPLGNPGPSDPPLGERLAPPGNCYQYMVR